MTSGGPILKFAIEGSITESTELFLRRLEQPQEIHVDLTKMTYINSAGVKAWIFWLTSLPRNCRILIENAPYVLVNQANVVRGFFPPGSRIQSFRSFYICPQCQTERNVQLIRGTHYDYPSGEHPAWTRPPQDLFCPKCQVPLEADFIESKAFQFLRTSP